MTYTLLDSGEGRKLEQFGEIILERAAPTALWKKRKPKLWKPHASFEEKSWRIFKKFPNIWEIEISGIVFKLKLTDFGHLGLFPEQEENWKWLQKVGTGKVLNLFAYSGGSTLACPGEVTHLDAAKGMVEWAKENAELNGRTNIRWIVDDVTKFLKREVKRKATYDGIILDPPTFGRGKSQEVFKIERDLPKILDFCAELKPNFILLSCHTPGYTPIILKQLLEERFAGEITHGEMKLAADFDLPSGGFARWHR